MGTRTYCTTVVVRSATTILAATAAIVTSYVAAYAAALGTSAGRI